jgi:phage terminase large subunit-like protein
LRPACLAADEIHEWDNAGGRDQWSKLTSGMVSRAHPLTLAISTSGGQQRGFGWEKYSVVKKILQGIFPAEDVFCCVWELDEADDYRDRALWPKANPALLGGHLKIEALEKQFAETEQDPSALSSFLRYQCNRWVSFNKTAGSIPLAKWDECRGYHAMPPDASSRQLTDEFLKYNLETPCYVGFDWGEINDLACAAFLFPYAMLADGSKLQVKVLIPYFWMPEAFVQQREKEWQVPVAQWVREGFIDVCSGDMNDAAEVRHDIVEICGLLRQVKSLGFDPWHSRQIAATIAEEARIECIEIPQRPSILTPLAVSFKALIYEKKLWHLGNPVLRWMAGNVRLEREGKYGVIVPTKPDKNAKIDGIQAALSALHRLENAPPPSCYLERGLVFI